MAKPLKLRELGEYVRRKRLDEKLSLRQVAEQVGVSAATLSRIENGVGVPDSSTLMRLASWLGIPLDRILRGVILEEAGSQAPDTSQKEEPVIYYPTEPIPDIVEAHLRADRNLKPETAKALAELFRLAYKQFASAENEKER